MLTQVAYLGSMDETMTLTLRTSRISDARRFALRSFAIVHGIAFEVDEFVVRMTATTPPAMRALATVA